MNIKEAKMEVEKAVKVYLEKDENGEYRVPLVRQRPLFLVGAPGLGKTAIMEQVAEDLDIALVSYSMTHHTRQSAIGLPYLKEVTYNGQTYTKSEYTMSEIIASVYDVIQSTGKKEGILFLDEINCVSETLAPAMLLFLQYKRFGNQSVPEGWVVVTAGNPPQYNKSVKEFDVATQDRLKMLTIDADFGCWKEYAYNAGIHPAITAFLEANNGKWFYDIKTTVDGQQYITARGWEDLSSEIQAYERNGFPVTQELIMEYITNKECARKFAVYYDLFKKYRVDYAISDIIAGNISAGAIQKAQAAKFDERLSIISMLMEALGISAKDVMVDTEALESVVKKLRVIKKKASDMDSVYQMLAEDIADVHDEMDKAKKANALSSAKKAILMREVKLMESYKDKMTEFFTNPDVRKKLEEKTKKSLAKMSAFDVVKMYFLADVKKMQNASKKTSASMENAFKYMEKAFGDDQEMTLFVAELTVNRNIANFIAKNGSDAYYKHNSSMLIYNEDDKLNGQIDQLLDEAV